jgi:molybdopterin molybdotransferase
MAARGPREFFAVRPVSEALSDFRPAHRTGAELVALDASLGRVPVEAVVAREPLPGFARATVDGYAVRAADTYGASEGLPAYLNLTGEAVMGRPPEIDLSPGGAVAIATGAPLPKSADAVVMVEHTQAATAELIEVLRPVAPGDGVVLAGEDAVSGAELVPAGRPLRPQEIAMLAAAGVVELSVHARPRVTIVSTGDELVSTSTPGLEPGQVRDAVGPGLAALTRQAGGSPVFGGIVPDDRTALTETLTRALPDSDVLVVSAGSSVGARDETAAAIEGLGEPGIWCHGLMLKPGKPTLLADARGVPVIGLPGNPRSALVVYRLLGMPIVWHVGGCSDPPAEPVTRARLDRHVPSAAGRLDIVQVSLADGVATPRFGSSSLLSVMTEADGFVCVPEPATGLAEGGEVEVTLYG